MLRSRPDKAVGRPFCENFLILVKCPRDSRKKSDLFRCKKISQKLKYLNFKCEQSERYFFVLFCSFHHSAHVPCEKVRLRLAKRISGNQALFVIPVNTFPAFTLQRYLQLSPLRTESCDKSRHRLKCVPNGFY